MESKVHMFQNYLVNRLYLQKINLKKSLSRGVALRFTFVWNAEKIEDHAKISTKPPFSGDRKIIIPSHVTTSISYHTYSNHEI